MQATLVRPVSLLCTLALIVEDLYSAAVMFAKRRAENFEHIHKAALMPL